MATLSGVSAVYLAEKVAVDVGNVGPIPVEVANLPAPPYPVQDDYAVGELLEDQATGVSAGVLTFTFSQPVVSFWVAVQGLEGTAKVDHYGGIPSATRGIPVEAGGALPIAEPTQTVRIYTPANLRVTVWGQRRA